MEKILFGNNPTMIKLLVIYDIVNDVRRKKVAKILEGYGYRVQYSAFECILNSAKYKRLLAILQQEVCAEDNLRVYQLGSLPIVNKEYEEVAMTEFDLAIC